MRARYSVPPEEAEKLGRFVTALSEKYGIADAVALGKALVKLSGDVHAYRTGGGMVRAGSLTGPCTGETYARAGRIAALVAELDGELAAAPWPLAGEEADALRQALASYQKRLETLQWSTIDGRASNKPKSEGSIIAMQLAWTWRALTGSAPTAWRDNATGRPGGRFYEFVTDICTELKLDTPSPDTVRAVRKHIDLSGQKVAQ